MKVRVDSISCCENGVRSNFQIYLQNFSDVAPIVLLALQDCSSDSHSKTLSLDFLHYPLHFDEFRNPDKSRKLELWFA